MNYLKAGTWTARSQLCTFHTWFAPYGLIRQIMAYYCLLILSRPSKSWSFGKEPPLGVIQLPRCFFPVFQDTPEDIFLHNHIVVNRNQRVDEVTLIFGWSSFAISLFPLIWPQYMTVVFSSYSCALCNDMLINHPLIPTITFVAEPSQLWVRHGCCVRDCKLVVCRYLEGRWTNKLIMNRCSLFSRVFIRRR